MKYGFSAMYQNVPVKSAEIHGKRKHAVMSARARWMISLGYVMRQLHMLMNDEGVDLSLSKVDDCLEILAGLVIQDNLVRDCPSQ